MYAAEYLDPDLVYVDGYMTGGCEFGPPDVLDPLFRRYLEFAAHARMAKIEKVLGRPGSILDIGCGTGDLLAVAAGRGWTVTGVELVAESVALATERGLDVRCVRLEESGLPERSFDLVSAFHVVEHMPNAAEFVALLSRWARPGGHVLFEVPNWNSLARRADGDRWNSWRPLEHLAHYTPKTLRRTIERGGAELVHVSTTGFLWEEQTMGEALADLGMQRALPIFKRLARRGQREGQEVLAPTATGWKVLRTLEAASGRAGLGAVVQAIARVRA